MQYRKTRSNKELELVNLTNQELAELERAGRRARRQTKMVNPVILTRDEAGVLTDQEGHVCNEQGQRIDEAGNVLPGQDVGVERHDEEDIERHQEIEQNPAAIVRRDAQLQQGRRPIAPNNGRTLGEFNRPDQFYANRSAIRPPMFQRNDFELKPAYFTLVSSRPFHGLSSEHPMDHIERFEDIATSIKANGVPKDYLLCKLFPYSLGGEAAYWLKQLPTGSLTTWEETKTAFLNNFYDDARSEELRNKISMFTQEKTEAFKTAWMRFKSYQRDCPHHGFNDVQLLSIFYRGVDWRYQIAMDAASNGNFNTNYPDEALVLIENLASSSSTKNADFERKKQAKATDGAQIAEVKATLDTVHSILTSKKSVHFSKDLDTSEPDQQEEDEENVNYIGGGFQGQRFGNQQGNRGFNQGGYNQSGYNQRSSFQGSPGYVPKADYQKQFQTNSGGGFNKTHNNPYYQAAPQNQDNGVQAVLDKILEGQQNLSVELNGKLDNVYTTLNDKIEALNIHVKKLDSQVAQTAGSVKRQEGFLPGKTDSNPKHSCNAILIQDGDDVWEEEESDEDQFTVEEVMSSYAPGCCSDLAGARAKRREEQGLVKPSTRDMSVDRCYSNCIDRHEAEENNVSTGDEAVSTRVMTTSSTSTASVDRYPSTSIDRHSFLDKLPTLVIPPSVAYKPKVPYPKARTSKKEMEEMRCKAMMSKIRKELPENEKLDTSPSMQRLVKRMVQSELTPEQGALLTRDISAVFLSLELKKPKEKREEVLVSEQVSAVIQKRLPKKLPDPGSFVLDCSISNERFRQSLCDLGSSINLMPHSVAIRLGMTRFQKTRITVVLADRSKRTPVGILEDVPVKVGECIIPTDFVVLDYDDEPSDPILLGRSFLATAGAVIDVKRSHMTLNIDDVVLNFDMVKLRNVPSTAGQISSVTTSEDPPIPLSNTEAIIPPPVTLQKPSEQPRYVSPEPDLSTPVNKNSKTIRAAMRLTKPQDSRRAHFCSSNDVSGTRTSETKAPQLASLSKHPNAYTPPWKKRLSAQSPAQTSPDI